MPLSQSYSSLSPEFESKFNQLQQEEDDLKPAKPAFSQSSAQPSSIDRQFEDLIESDDSTLQLVDDEELRFDVSTLPIKFRTYKPLSKDLQTLRMSRLQFLQGKNFPYVLDYISYFLIRPRMDGLRAERDPRLGSG